MEDYEYDYEPENNGHDGKTEIGAEPSVQFTRETWWDTLLGLYYSHTQPQSQPNQHLALSQHLTPGLRESLTQRITADLRFLFRTSNYWFAFVNVPRFFARLLDPTQRAAVQPSVILSALACANFIRSSNQEDGQDGRNWALTLLERAQASLDASLNSRWVDESLVQASWVRLLVRGHTSLILTSCISSSCAFSKFRPIHCTTLCEYAVRCRCSTTSCGACRWLNWTATINVPHVGVYEPCQLSPLRHLSPSAIHLQMNLGLQGSPQCLLWLARRPVSRRHLIMP